ncbi:hypothetical protein [Streptomyces sp. NEAU-174]|uniref:hypothetical protein n=1 Tax=Streptomyces sp. NEAU-174 TaxID=3458254 RepID=UPI004043C727
MGTTHEQGLDFTEVALGSLPVRSGRYREIGAGHVVEVSESSDGFGNVTTALV